MAPLRKAREKVRDKGGINLETTAVSSELFVEMGRRVLEEKLRVGGRS